MNKKFEYHKEYPEAVYKDRVYRWFNDNTSTMCDADLQKFVNDAMHGKLTFQCADEIDIDDPDISMIDYLLMDIASEKNDELINTYTDEIDWDNYYIEKYNRGNNMDKKLEARVARLERLASRKRVKNEGRGREAALRVSEFGGTLLSYMMDLDTYATGELSSKLNEAYSALTDLVNFIDSQLDIQ